MKKWLTLIKKEAVENRMSLFGLPLAIGSLLIIVVIAGLIWQHLAAIEIDVRGVEALASLELAERQKVAAGILTALGMPFLSPLVLVVIFYLAHALFDERKDGSILFWKSLPVSDALTVQSKMTMALLVFPLVYWLAFVFTHVVLLSAISIFGLGHEINLWALLWSPASVASHALNLLVALLIHGFWMLPIYAWLLFCSSWAPKSPLLMAIAIVAVTSLSLGLWRVMTTGQWHGFEPLAWAGQRFGDGPLPMSVMLNFSDSSPQITMKSTALVELMGYLGSLQLWLGVVLALPLLWGAVYMRRRAAA